MPQIENEYVKTGKLLYVVRDFPLEAIHPQAFKAAEAARCAGDQGKYWEMHDRLFANPRALGPTDLSAAAQGLGLDPVPFQKCLESGTKAVGVRRDLAEGQRAGVTGTPAFFLVRIEPGETTARVIRGIRGAQPFAAFKEAIDAALAAPAAK